MDNLISSMFIFGSLIIDETFSFTMFFRIIFIDTKIFDYISFVKFIETYDKRLVKARYQDLYQ